MLLGQGSGRKTLDGNGKLQERRQTLAVFPRVILEAAMSVSYHVDGC